jgi:hypothetical protein
MYKYQNINIGSFTNLDEISKGKEKVTMDKKDFVEEHKKLVNVLESDSHKDDKKEAKDQKKELDEELKKGGEGSKGGKIIGHTQSGKPIYDSFNHPEHKDFTKQDHKNAAYQHSIIAANSKKRVDDAEVSNKNATGADKVYNDLILKHHKPLMIHHNKQHESHNKAGEEIKKSFDMDISNKTISNSDLIKSHIGYQFSSSENLKVTKKGSEIKEKLKAIKDKELLEISGYQSKMEALKAVIPTAPSEPANDYNYEGIEVLEKLMMFPWNETYCNGDNEKSDMVISASETKPEKSEAQILCDNKREYNRNVDKIIECQKEIVLINTMLNNFSDSKTYDLSVRQAAVLGF